ncbi:bax inhibitor protein [Naegleria gruberi]|uniref:Bax inhibitor protein n=1 Tax=Naegleria gruberi TaxID=5762 RepID=D2VBF0_NAEGR|nr:bax inhibitor protein [Naegleria gruberi]EFC45786.1 bax inhibitor protein [Naegleria gruberi]|eukprot:XP_002678530.1 bax inhibitor protein [Naegleria gruberi strain NEG-M]
METANLFQTLTNFAPLSREVKQHLTDVYTILAGLVAVAAFGCWFQINYDISASFAGIMIPVFALLLTFSQPQFGVSVFKQYYRLGLLVTLGLMQGIATGPVVNYALDLNETVVLQAFVLTCVIFGCFTVAAMMNERRDYLYLSGFISSLSLILLFNSLFRFSFNLTLYGGLILFVLYILYDTQMIIRKVELVGAKNSDAISHSLELFIDFAQLFIRILVLLSDKEENKKKKKN